MQQKMHIQTNHLNIALDIGGTLTKVALHSTFNDLISLNFPSLDFQQLQIKNNSYGNTVSIKFYFTSFDCFQDFLTFLNLLTTSDKYQSIDILITGGGAFKHKGTFQNIKNQYHKVNFKISSNQFQAVLSTISLLNNDDRYKCLIKKSRQSEHKELFKIITPNENLKSTQFKMQLPLILANIGSGMSVLKVQKVQQKITFTRIGGSALGGAFLIGLEKIMNTKFQFKNLDSIDTQITSEQKEILRSWILNIYQIVNLYSDIHNINNILLMGGVTASNTIRKQFQKAWQSQRDSNKYESKDRNEQKQKDIEQKQEKTIFFTQLDGYSGVSGLLIQHLKLV